MAAPGTTLVISGSTVRGSVIANRGGAFSLCGSTVSSKVTVSRAAGFVLVGDPGDDGCAGNSISGSVTLTSNTGGVEVSNNPLIGGRLKLSHNSGGGPFDDAAPEVEANVIHGGISCTGNTPAPTNDGQPNTVSGIRSGQCNTPGF